MNSAEQTYREGHGESVLRSHVWRTAENSAGYLLPYLHGGLDVLDVGCGPGTITADLAERVDPGRVTGIDPSPDVLEQAGTTAAQRGVENVRFVEGDVYELGDDTYDIVHAHQVLLHVPDPVEALRAMLRVTKPDGLVAARDTDYAGMSWWPEDPRLDRWLEVYRSVAHAHGGECDAGRRMLSWARAAGASEVTPSGSVWCYATPQDRAWWGGMWADRIVDSRLAQWAVDDGHASRAELKEMSVAWREWSQNPDGWFLVPHGEIICRP